VLVLVEFVIVVFVVVFVLIGYGLTVLALG
jgi:hypothetical protein